MFPSKKLEIFSGLYGHHPQITEEGFNFLSLTKLESVKALKEELQLLQEPGSYVGEVVIVMWKFKVLVKVHPKGKYVVDIDKSIDITKITPSTRVVLKNDSYVLEAFLELLWLPF